MYAVRAFILWTTLLSCFYKQLYCNALPQLPSHVAVAATEELLTCEQQLSKYRKFLLQAILSFEDVCDAYNAHTTNTDDAAANNPADILFRHYQPAAVQRTEIWAFFKLLMAQFNDVEFTNVIRDAVIERCHIKSQLQRDEKRNTNGLVLGKKQRFHSWGGKRSPQTPGPIGGAGGAATFGGAGLLDNILDY